MQTVDPRAQPPSFWRWTLVASATAALTGALCCIAPAVLFLFGAMGGISAISFANWFYLPGGGAGASAWALRGLAAVAGVAGVVLYRRRVAACTTDPRVLRRRVTLALLMVGGLGTGLFLMLYRLTTWYFDGYVVPAQQAEYRQAAGAR
jgi:hypothetical protein